LLGRHNFATESLCEASALRSACGNSKDPLGVVAHGLRHQHANDAYEEVAGAPSLVRGGKVRPRLDDEARQRTARLLGHSRERAASCILGSKVGKPNQRNQLAEPPAP